MPGFSPSSTGSLSRQLPSDAPSTTSQGSIYVTSTFQVSDGAQCGGTGGARPSLPFLLSGQSLHLCGGDWVFRRCFLSQDFA